MSSSSSRGAATQSRDDSRREVSGSARQSSSRNSSSVSGNSRTSRTSGGVRSDGQRTSSTPRPSSDRNSVRESSRRVGNATRDGLERYSPDRYSRPGNGLAPERSSDFMRLGDNHDVHRIPPRDRHYVKYDAPCHFWGHDHHYYGYRVDYLPPRYKRIRHWGIDYCLYGGVYYRPYNGIYVVCRPPVGVSIAYDIAVGLSFRSVRFAYYTDAYRTYRIIDDNYRIIDEQNRTIARNNALLASQDRYLAMNTTRARDAYSLAERLGLAQSYAYADKPYFYQDGVFYINNSNGQYEVIVPPAGALVDELPDDYDTITIDGIDLYKVDNTVYRLTLVEGVPYLEVLGQMYGSMARKYDYYSGSRDGYRSLY